MVVVLALAWCPALAAAEAAIELPALSPHARAEQQVGITEIAIDYSCPGVKGRKIWGDLVPYDKVWRAGARAPTKLTVSHDFSFGGTPVKAGTYSLFMIPGKASWAVMLNTDLNVMQWDHDAKNDVARITVKPGTLPAARERLRYTFDDTQDGKTSLDLEWERVRISVPIAIDTPQLIEAAIDKAMGDAWRTPFTAASYLSEAGKGDRALALVDQSIALRSTWSNEWLRAQIEATKGNKVEALAAAARAQELGKGDQEYESSVKPKLLKAVASWK